MSWIKNAWQVAAHAREVAAGLVSRTYCGVPVVLYRSMAGRPVAMGSLSAPAGAAFNGPAHRR